MGATSPNRNSNSKYRNPTFYYNIGILDPLGAGLSERLLKVLVRFSAC